MKSSLFKISVLIGIFSIVIYACKDKDNNEKLEETVLQGTATIYVDQTLQPIVEDQTAVFESQYNVKLNLVNQSESEVVNALLTDKTQIAVLSRKLTKEEENHFNQKKIIPKITHFASDAIVFITNKASQDTLIDLQEVLNLLQEKESKIKALVFENPNSSIVSYMNNLAGVKNGQKKNIYSLNSHKEVLEYVSNNQGSIGVIGLNLLVQPFEDTKQYTDKIAVMSVRNVKSQPNNVLYYKPNQSNLGEGLYPLKRPIYMLNYQGTAGLGMGFASFVAGDIGQRIILKSGLLPVRIPSRELNIRKEIINNK
ncbi:phosphate transport system substrate-binding protein [Flavobacterium arsenatis]|uniref:Phosphate transport system substrate-binding protein n=1 Tax=Flavobacterium arsenatis TaxID=1484332 RepID=A0ABU1TMB5_9FLAO|nr:substrate-binding domain-containing protein [Flavobacterium arsenatis]MDR6966563.1 phosphate transport system substrate-binding protein [Flavobacterium arsenatis]